MRLSMTGAGQICIACKNACVRFQWKLAEIIVLLCYWQKLSGAVRRGGRKVVQLLTCLIVKTINSFFLYSLNELTVGIEKLAIWVK